MVGLAPVTVVDDLASRDAYDPECARSVTKRVGEREIGAVAMPGDDPALDAVELANCFSVGEDGIEIVVCVPNRAATSSRLKTNDRADVAHELGNRAEVVVAAWAAVEEQERRSSSCLHRPDLSPRNWNQVLLLRQSHRSPICFPT